MCFYFPFQMESELQLLITGDIRQILPNLDPAKAEALSQKLVQDQIGSLTNLKYVKEQEISSFVGLYDARALLDSWQKRGSKWNNLLFELYSKVM